MLKRLLSSTLLPPFPLLQLHSSQWSLLNTTRSTSLVATLYHDDTTAIANPKLAHKAKWSDLFTVLAAGAALISDGYQNNLMTLLNPLFATRYGKVEYSSAVSTRVSNSLLVGAILGQVSIGVVCDRVGRKSAIIAATLLLFLGAVFATAATAVNGDVSALFWWFTIARGATGVGLGGEYPTSSASASEASNERYGREKRSTIFILCTNVVLSMGGPLAVSCFLIVLSATSYGNTSSPLDLKRLDITWRVCAGIGAVLPLSVIYFRLKMLNSKLYRQGAIKHNVPYFLFLKRYWRRMIGTTMVWFLYDFVAFSNGAFSGSIIASVLKNPTLKRTAEYQLLLGALALPGAFIGAWLVKLIGTKWQLVTGFTGYIVLGLIIGLAWDKIIDIPVLFVILYALLTSSGNLGPGSICGLIASDSYPSALRGSAYGLSAAIGKVGAAVGTEVFTPIQNGIGKKYTFIVAAGVGVLGVLLALFTVVDTTKLNLEEEDRKWEAYLVEHGWKGVVGCDETAFGVKEGLKAEHRVEEQQDDGLRQRSVKDGGSDSE
ncbi:MFS general substrate transporter [Jaminaea rosea]|uniref:MFS general substrate transporter n=1 Tax=Jaminaea rosea TaxID=1569628 RepID=A0A316UJI8_9BASI|nr:MFS general substrate transporter [Jaminaea rosea]PWN25094.1 MFS general substrate transporter [Jaminaea rosea]